MDPLDDKELNQLLQKWEAPVAPAGMRVAAGRAQQSLWKWAWSGRIQVPVPIGAAIVFGAITFWIYSSRSVQAPIAIPAGKAVVNPTAPQVSPNPSATPRPVEHTSPLVGEKESAVTAALSGFQPVQQLEPRVVRVQP